MKVNGDMALFHLKLRIKRGLRFYLRNGVTILRFTHTLNSGVNFLSLYDLSSLHIEIQMRAYNSLN